MRYVTLRHLRPQLRLEMKIRSPIPKPVTRLLDLALTCASGTRSQWLEQGCQWQEHERHGDGGASLPNIRR